MAGIGATAVVVAACIGAGLRLPGAMPAASSIAAAATAPATATATAATAAASATAAGPTPGQPLASSTPAMVFDPGTTVVGIPPVTNTRPLPACTYGNVATPLTGAGDWRLTLVDTQFTLPPTYAPQNLANPGSAGIKTFYRVRLEMLPDLRAMVSAAKRAGAVLGMASGYRDYYTQVYTFRHWVNLLGQQTALLQSARAGHSEHQLGVAIDFRDLSSKMAPWSFKDFARQTVAGAWLKANAWKYGFIMSYPKGMTALTCYAYEPWHYRYVGPPAAAQIHESGQTLREWLWQRQPASSLPAAAQTPQIP